MNNQEYANDTDVWLFYSGSIKFLPLATDKL